MMFAVHISDGVLEPAWLVGGFAVAALLYLPGCWRIGDKDLDELPKLALLTAAFFVITQIHLNVPPSSVHLLANGLLGVLLGRRVCLAIPVALALQAVFGHGGFSTLGINSVVFIIPALAASGVFHTCQRADWVRLPAMRTAFVFATILAWGLIGVFSVALLLAPAAESESMNVAVAWAAVCHPLAWVGSAALAGLAAYVERRLETAPEFPLGLMIGGMTALFTVALNCLVLAFGAAEDWHQLVLLVFIRHLPIALIEGIVLGFTVGYLARVKPEMVGGAAAERVECVVDSAS